MIARMAFPEIFRSQARRRLLELFFTDPEAEYHLRDCARRIGMSLGAVQNVIGRLEREGLLLRRSLGNLALFRLNRGHPLFDELSSVVAKTVGLAPRLREALRRLRGVRLAFLYGSYVSAFGRGDSAWTGRSDVDLLVVGDVDPRAVSRMTRQVAARAGRPINYTILTERELRDKIARSDSFLMDVLSKPVLPLAGFPESRATIPLRLKPVALEGMLRNPA
jgi:predicted nucleotidyltransferase